MEEKKEALKQDLVNFWYGNQYVSWNMFVCLKNRYMSIFPKGRPLIRGNKITSHQLILKDLLTWRVEDDHKLYMDLTQWKDMPLFSFDPTLRSENRRLFNENVENNILEVDFAVDIDAEKDREGNKKDWKKTHERAIKCMNFLKKKGIKFSCWNSSNNGFQFFAKGEQFKVKAGQEKITHYQKIAKEMKGVYPDMAIYDLRRIIKLPYSLCNGVVVLPMTEEQLLNFTPEMVRPSEVIKKFKIYNRGLPLIGVDEE